MKLRIRVTPNARRSEIIGWEDDPVCGRVLRVRVAAPPLDGKANAELRRFLARALRISQSGITLDKGDSSRIKTFLIPDGVRLPD